MVKIKTTKKLLKSNILSRVMFPSVLMITPSCRMYPGFITNAKARKYSSVRNYAGEQTVLEIDLMSKKIVLVYLRTRTRCSSQLWGEQSVFGLFEGTSRMFAPTLGKMIKELVRSFWYIIFVFFFSCQNNSRKEEIKIDLINLTNDVGFNKLNKEKKILIIKNRIFPDAIDLLVLADFNQDGKLVFIDRLETENSFYIKVKTGGFAFKNKKEQYGFSSRKLKKQLAKLPYFRPVKYKTRIMLIGQISGFESTGVYFFENDKYKSISVNTYDEKLSFSYKQFIKMLNKNWSIENNIFQSSNWKW